MLQQHTFHISVLFRSISPERTFIGLIYTVGVSAGFYGLARLEQLKPGRAAFENSAAASSRLRVLVQYDITFLPEVISTNYNEHTLRRAVITGNLVLAIGKSFSMRVDDRPLGRKRCERTWRKIVVAADWEGVKNVIFDKTFFSWVKTLRIYNKCRNYIFVALGCLLCCAGKTLF